MMICRRKLHRGQDVRDRTRIRGELPQAAIAHPLSRKGSPATRAVGPRNLPALLAAALNEKVTVTENGKRRQVTKREAVIAQLVNKSASAELRATKMLIDMLRDIEKRAEPLSTAKSPFGPTDKEVVQQLVTRLRRNMCNGCPWAAQRVRLEASPAPAPAGGDAMAADLSRVNMKEPAIAPTPALPRVHACPQAREGPGS